MTTDLPAAPSGLLAPDLPAGPADTGAISARPPADVYGALESSSQGLARPEAASRLAALGPNELPAARRPPVIRKVLAQFTNLFALVLLAASVITFASYLVQSPRDAGNLELAVAILAVVVLNGAIGFFQEYSAEKTSEALQALVPHTARVRRDGALADIPARGIVRGDVFVLEAGDDICCDGRLVVPPMRTASCMTHAISHACERRVLSKCCSGPWQGAPRNLRWHGRARIFLMKRQCTLSMTAT